MERDPLGKRYDSAHGHYNHSNWSRCILSVYCDLNNNVTYRVLRGSRLLITCVLLQVVKEEEKRRDKEEEDEEDRDSDNDDTCLSSAAVLEIQEENLYEDI